MNAATHQPHAAHAYDSKFAELAVLLRLDGGAC